jgi:hypothetical protein
MDKYERMKIVEEYREQRIRSQGYLLLQELDRAEKLLLQKLKSEEREKYLTEMKIGEMSKSQKRNAEIADGLLYILCVV